MEPKLGSWDRFTVINPSNFLGSLQYLSPMIQISRRSSHSAATFFLWVISRMVAMLDKQMSNPHIERIDRMKCSLASKSIIAVSVKGGYRTKEDWERYFSMEKANKDDTTCEWALQDAMKDIDAKTGTAPLTEAAKENVQHLTPGRKKSKACPLIDYLPADSGEAIISYIRKYIMTHQSGIQQALPYFVLKEMPLRLPLLNGVEYATAMTRQFPDVSELLSEHSLRQAVGKLAGTETQLLEKDSKKLMCRYIESDANQKLLEELRNDIGKII